MTSASGDSPKRLWRDVAAYLAGYGLEDDCTYRVAQALGARALGLYARLVSRIADTPEPPTIAVRTRRLFPVGVGIVHPEDRGIVVDGLHALTIWCAKVAPLWERIPRDEQSQGLPKAVASRTSPERSGTDGEEGLGRGSDGRELSREMPADEGGRGQNTAVQIPDDAVLPSAKLAEEFQVPHEPLRKRLDRLRRSDHNCFIENEGRKAKEAKYLYRVGAVRPIIADMKASSKTSGERPARK